MRNISWTCRSKVWCVCWWCSIYSWYVFSYLFYFVCLLIYFADTCIIRLVDLKAIPTGYLITWWICKQASSCKQRWYGWVAIGEGTIRSSQLPADLWRHHFDHKCAMQCWECLLLLLSCRILFLILSLLGRFVYWSILAQ